jgi:hypothetical protein
MTSPDESIDELEKKDKDELTAEANLARSKLLHAVEVLDRRRHDAMDVGLQVRKHAAPVGVAATVVVGGIVAVTALLTHHLAKAPERRRRQRVRMLARIWDHPDKVGARRSLVGDLGRSILVGLLSAAVLIPARLAMKRLVLLPR